MKLKIFLAAALCTLLSTAALAQHEGHGGKAPDPHMAMMEMMEKAATPGGGHKKLDVLAGTWDAEVVSWMMPGSDPVKSRGTAENHWTLGGRYLEQRFKGSFMGMPFEGMGYTGYDNIKQQYWGTWMDTMSTALMMSTGGTLSADGTTFTFKATMPDPMSGKDSTVEEKIIVKDADHHVMEMWGAGPDGKVFKMMEIAYSRKK